MENAPAICRVCGKTNRAGVKFCVGCGNIVESQSFGVAPMDSSQGSFGAQTPPMLDPEATRRSLFDSPGGAAGAGMGSYSPAMPAAGLAPGAGYAPALAPCANCGAVIRPGLNFCEMCGKPVGYVATMREARSYKWVIVTGIIVLVMGAAAAGYHFWGVKLTINVSAEVAGTAEIILDGEPLGRTEKAVTINHVLRGKHEIVIKRDGFKPYTETVELGLMDFSKTIDVALTRNVFMVTLKGTPNDSKVKVQLQDNDDPASSPKDVTQWDNTESAYIVRDVVQGKAYTLTMKRPGYRDFKKDISLSANETINVNWIISLAGEWTGSYTDSSYTASGAETRFTLTLTDNPATSSATSASNVTFSGTLSDGVTYTISEGSVSPSTRYVSFKVVRGESTYNFSGNLDADMMRLTGGSWYTTGTGYGYGSWSMTRSQTTTR